MFYFKDGTIVFHKAYGMDNNPSGKPLMIES